MSKAYPDCKVVGEKVLYRQFAYLNKRHPSWFGVLEAVDYSDAVRWLGSDYWIKTVWMDSDYICGYKSRDEVKAVVVRAFPGREVSNED